MLRLESGRQLRADRQHGGPTRKITVELAAVYLLWLVPPKTQRLLERIGRLHKEDCWSPAIVGVPFDQSPSAYLYSEHAPERAPIVGAIEQPKRNYQRLLADQGAHNERWGSYWNSPRNAGRANLSKMFRLLRSLNITRETIEARDNMIANLQHDFDRRDEPMVA